MAFNLSEMLRDVPNLDTSREQIEYIPLSLIDSDENNFYKLSEIPALADNIATCGLQQPIRLRRNPGADGRYIIVSGHRRRAALEELAKEDAKWSDVPCIVEKDDASPALRQLRLIYANSATRDLTSAEIFEQSQQVKQLLYQLKEEGHEFPGRMRDHVAEACNISKSKLARLEVIQKGLEPCWDSSWQDAKLSEDAAYHLAKQAGSLQRIIFDAAGVEYSRVSSQAVESAVELNKQIASIQHECGMALCPNRERMLKKMVKAKMDSSYYNCRGCCKSCGNRLTCPASCNQVASEKREYRAEQKASREAHEKKSADEQSSVIAFCDKAFGRIFSALAQTDINIEDFLNTSLKYKYLITPADMESIASGETKVGYYTYLPYGCNFSTSNAMHLVAAADLLGVTTDYLLGREQPKPASGWHSGHPSSDGEYLIVHTCGYGKKKYYHTANWRNGTWQDGDLVDCESDLGWTILGWTELLEEN